MRWMLPMLALPFAAAAHAAPPVDPLGSPAWEGLAKTLFGDASVRFDDRVRVRFPSIAENQHQFPVEVDARGIPGARRILIFADLNPIPLAIDFTPARAAPFIATRIKLDQRTPVRGAVQLADGSWLVAGGWIDAAGGGCSAPPVSRVKGDWAQHLGEIRGVALAGHTETRVHIVFRHPMDTGFVSGVPTYHLQTVTVRGGEGADFGTIALEAAVGEDPALSIVVAVIAARPGDVLMVAGEDSGGVDYAATLRIAPMPAPAGAR